MFYYILGGCSLLQPQPLPAPEPIIKTVTEYKTLEIYQPPLPKAIDLQDVEFFVITEKNFEEQVKKLEKMQSGTYVLFGITPQDYENMAYNLQELKGTLASKKKLLFTIVKLHKAMKTQTLKIGWNEMKKFLRINNRTKLWLFKLVELTSLPERY